MAAITSIHISVIPHARQRYETAGDWSYQRKPDGSLELLVSVSALPDPRMHFAVAVHEVVEALLCNARGITQDAVDDWDINGAGSALAEPGDDPAAPYFNEHQFATQIEEMLINEFEVDWHAYETALASLSTNNGDQS